MFPEYGNPRVSASPWHGASRARVFARHMLGHLGRWSWKTPQPLGQTSCSPAFGAGGVRMCSSWAKSRLLQNFCPSSGPPASQRDLFPSSRTSRLGFPVCGLTHLGRCQPIQSPFSCESPPRGTDPDLITIRPFLPDYLCIFLTVLVVQGNSRQFPVSHQW